MLLASSSATFCGLKAGCRAGAARVSRLGPGLSRSCRLPVRAHLELEQSAAAANTVWDSAAHHVNLVASVAEDTVNTVAAAVTTAAASGVGSAVRTDSGPFDFLAEGFEKVLEVLDELLVKLHVPYSYGFAIILLTVMVKLAAFPLSQKQVMSTLALQALQPRVKELQAKYANDTETLQMETAKLYRDAGVNPLAGCLPTLATIPVFIGLYRALTLAAQDNLLNDPFFWIPSLGGPATVAMQQNGSGLSWLFPLVDGHPPIGWQAAGQYLLLPVLLVASQYYSQRILSPPSNDPAQAQTQAILKFLPLMIGWFSLNVPAGLTLYWFVNNILSTAQQVYLKQTTKIEIPEPAAASTGAKPAPYIAPKEEKVKKITGKDINSRRKKRDGEDDSALDVEVEVMAASTSSSSNGNGSTAAAKTGKSKGDKFRAQKAREAAARAASAAGGSTGSSPAPPASPPPEATPVTTGSSNGASSDKA